MAKQNTMGETFQELRELLVAYARQETVEPLGRLKRYLGFSIPGALFLALGIYLLSLGIVRGLQHISWTSIGIGSVVPYAVSVGFLVAAIGLLLSRLKRSKRAGDVGGGARPS
ncbi:MAG: phage holin family protein [Actinobacteria bacterium]|nr:phage holin family protein [Actinomycetota bacterium]